jgi:hypothetical protein
MARCLEKMMKDVTVWKLRVQDPVVVNYLARPVEIEIAKRIARRARPGSLRDRMNCGLVKVY